MSSVHNVNDWRLKMACSPRNVGRTYYVTFGIQRISLHRNKQSRTDCSLSTNDRPIYVCVHLGGITPTLPGVKRAPGRFQEAAGRGRSSDICCCCCHLHVWQAAPRTSSVFSRWGLRSLRRRVNGDDCGESGRSSGGPCVFVPVPRSAGRGCARWLRRRWVRRSGGGAHGERAAAPERPGRRDERGRSVKSMMFHISLHEMEPQNARRHR